MCQSGGDRGPGPAAAAARLGRTARAAQALPRRGRVGVVQGSRARGRQAQPLDHSRAQVLSAFPAWLLAPRRDRVSVGLPLPRRCARRLSEYLWRSCLSCLPGNRGQPPVPAPESPWRGRFARPRLCAFLGKSSRSTLLLLNFACLDNIPRTASSNIVLHIIYYLFWGGVGGVN